MPIRFERHQKFAHYLDPRTDYQEKSIACEMRRDPLTGRSGRVAHGLGFRIQPLDVAPLVAASKPSCPFCPDRLFKVTPKFPGAIVPEGRLQLGEAVIFPNLVPYDEHSAVAVMSQEHYVPACPTLPAALSHTEHLGNGYDLAPASLPGALHGPDSRSCCCFPQAGNTPVKITHWVTMQTPQPEA